MPDAIPLRDRSPILQWLRRRPVAPRAARDSSTPRGIVAASGVSYSIGQTIVDVVGRAGGTRAERRDLTRELLVHFRDARDRGMTSEAALDAFGEPRIAARLLKRAMRRKRGFVWRSWWWASRGVAALILASAFGYGWLSARFWMARPNVAVNYRISFSALVPWTSAEDAAWPQYRKALTSLKRDESESPLNSTLRDDVENPLIEPRWALPLAAVTPGSAAWEAATHAIAQRQDAIASLRAAAMRAALGIVPGRISADDCRFFNLQPQYVADGREGSLIGTLLPHLTELHRVASWLACDARHAAEDGDSARAIDDVIALVGVARQVRDPFLVSQLVSQRVLASAAATTMDMIARHPERWSSRDLERLADTFDSIDSSLLHFDFAGERLMWADTAQRIFSDDGNGDGRLIASALRFDDAIMGGPDPRRSDALLASLAPLAVVSAPTRREATNRFEERIARLDALQHLPYSSWPSDVRDIDSSPCDWSFVRSVVPWLGTGTTGIGRIVDAPDAMRTRIDSARIAIAVARSNAARGTLPASLDALVPDYLASVPNDLWLAAPLRYAVRDGRATLWSVGPDRLDDGGVAAETGNLWMWQPPPGAPGYVGPTGVDLVLWTFPMLEPRRD